MTYNIILIAVTGIYVLHVCYKTMAGTGWAFPLGLLVIVVLFAAFSLWDDTFLKIAMAVFLLSWE